MELEDLEIYRNMNEREKVEVTVLASVRTQLGDCYHGKTCFGCVFSYEKPYCKEVIMCRIFMKRLNNHEMLPECKIFQLGT